MRQASHRVLRQACYWVLPDNHWLEMVGVILIFLHSGDWEWIESFWEATAPLLSGQTNSRGNLRWNLQGLQFIKIYWWASQNRRCRRAQATIVVLFFGQFLASEASQNKEGGVPPTPFQILNFKIFTKSKTWQFLELEARPGRHFLTVFYDVFCTCLNFYIKKCSFKN